MCRVLVAASVIVLCGTPALGAQSPAASRVAAVAPNRKDVASPDAIIMALYDANSVMVDTKRDADRFRSLFLPGARLMPTSNPPNGPARVTIYTVEDYVRLASSGRPRGGFSEYEIARTSDAFGNIMHVFSTYEARRDSTDTKPTRGINSIQLLNDGTRWWVVSVLWDAERANNPIPPAYLERRPKSP